MITGAHMIIFSTQPDADRAFLRDVLHLPHIDAGEGWLIFGLPPSEMAVHPHKRNNVQRIYLMCEDIHQFIAEMGRHAISCSEISEADWGLLTEVTLPGGGKLGVYQPRHTRAVE